MAYAVSEGVAFSIYHIAKHLGKLPAGEIILGGGAAKDPLLGQIKATLFDRPFVTPEESDTSALGAAMVAGLGIGEFGDMAEATAACVRKKAVHAPVPALREKLLRRFEIYENLYTALKPQFEKFKEI
jgi:xylulokinase